MFTILLFIMAGAIAGLLAGLFGVGGGLLIVPILAHIFQHQQVPENIIMHLAVGTSLATIVATGAASIFAHHRRSGVDWLVWRQMCIWLLLGSGFGAVVAAQASSSSMKICYIIFIYSVSICLAFSNRAEESGEEKSGFPGERGVVAFFTGAISAVVGIGGGTVIVPYLSWRGLSMVRAIGTSAACGLPIAAAGSIGYAVTGFGLAGLPAYSTGYVVWPAFVAVAVSSVALAPLGARLAHRWSAIRLRKAFAVFLVVLASYVLLK